jgi:hypothetical protein
MTDRQKESSEALRLIRLRILEARALGITLEELVESNAKKKKEDKMEEPPPPEFDDYSGYLSYQCGRFTHFARKCFHLFIAKMRTIIRKFAGAQVQPPPPFTWKQSAHTFFGVIVTLLIITNVNRRMLDSHGTDTKLALGPFGALVCLLCK